MAWEKHCNCVQCDAFPESRDEAGLTQSASKMSAPTEEGTADKRDTESVLREREARLRSILETAPEALVTIDEHGLIESFSKSAEILFGYGADEIVGRNVSTLMPAPHRDAHDGYINRYLTTGEKRIIGIGRTVEGLRKDGSTFPMELAVGEAIANGRRLFTGFIRDLTARHRMEHELRHAQKMEAVGQLTGGIAHDFNNLLTVILGNLEMLERRLQPDPLKRTLVREAQEAAQLGAKLTERLLAFGRRHPLDPKLVDISALVSEFAGLLRRTLGERVQVRMVVDEHNLQAVVDTSQLQNALLNLGINARDAMPEGGRLTIAVSRAELDDSYCEIHPDAVAGHYVLIAVTDGGTGMTEEVRDRAFEPFFTTKEVGAGTGLGLSQVYGFVKQSGGHVQLYSELGHGTTVRLFLPSIDERDSEAASSSHDPALLPRARGETVLVVEDDPRVRRVTVSRLRDLGYSVLEAENGPLALERLRHHGEVALVFTDMVMPGGMTGGDLAKAVQVLRPDIKLLLTSGYAEPDLVLQHPAPTAQWLMKPYTTAALAKKLRTVLD